MPYAPFFRVCGERELLFVSGQLPIRPGTDTVVPGGILAEVRCALENAVEVLRTAGADTRDIAKVTLYVTDLDRYSALNKVYSDFMAGHLPARSVVEVSRLPRGASVEIEVVAAVSARTNPGQIHPQALPR